MTEKIIKVKLKIFEEPKHCPSGHTTKYAILYKEKQACSFCLAEGNCDNWFKKEG